MLNAFLGSDRQKARAALERALGRVGKGVSVVRVSDASPLGDVQGALSAGENLFGESRAVVLDSVSLNQEMSPLLLEALSSLAHSSDHFFILEGKPNAELSRALKKYAENIETFDAAKHKESFPFALPDALRKGDKKTAWVAYHRQLADGAAPEALHGILFWAAKQMLLKARADSGEWTRARILVASLAQLPHESRRRGEELEYALERFLLSGA